MKLLGFETTDAIASVALLWDGQVFVRRLPENKRHAESVLPAAEELLREHGFKTSDMDAFAVDVGPGSFTGVRIGVCLANALAFAHRKNVISVSAPEVLAYPFFSGDRPICALIDARNGNGYGAVYQGGVTLIEPCACEIEPFLRALPKDCILTGTACSDRALPDAASVVRLAAEKQGQEQAVPLYLKPSQAERMQSR